MRINLKLLRTAKLLTMEEMAQATGVTRPTYSKIENGKAVGRMSFWRTLASRFAISESEIGKYKMDVPANRKGQAGR